MAKAFFSITPRAKIQAETVANIFWYYFDTGVQTVLSSAQQDDAIDSWITTVLPKYVNCLPSDCTMVDITCRGFSTTGAPSAELPTVRPAADVGGTGGSRDGNAHVAILKFTMGVEVTFSGNAAGLRSSSLRIGPLNNNCVDTDGSFIASGFGGTVAVDMEAAAAAPLTISVADDAPAIRVTHVLNHVASTHVQGWRLINSAHFTDRTGLLRRRTNGK